MIADDDLMRELKGGYPVRALPGRGLAVFQAVLEAEREIARVREEIERLDAQRTNLDRRVTYATVTLDVVEEPKAAMDMGPLPVPARLRNAFVDGIRFAVENLLGLSLTLLNVAPTAIVWIGLLFFPARFIIRRTWARG